MMRRLPSLVTLATSLLAAEASAQNLLLFDDTPSSPSGREASAAATRLGLTHTNVTNVAGLTRELATDGVYDLVVVDVSSLALPTTVATELEEHLATGGSLIFSFHDLDASATLRTTLDVTCGPSLTAGPLTSTPDGGVDIFRYAETFPSPMAATSRTGDLGDSCAPTLAGLRLAAVGTNPALVTSRDGQVIHVGLLPDAMRTVDGDTDGVQDVVELYSNLIELAFDLQAPDVLVYGPSTSPAVEAFSAAYEVDVTQVATLTELATQIADKEWRSVVFDLPAGTTLEAGLAAQIATLRAAGIPVVVLSPDAAADPALAAELGLSAPATVPAGVLESGSTAVWGDVLTSQPERLDAQTLTGADVAVFESSWLSLATLGAGTVIAGDAAGGLVVAGFSSSQLSAADDLDSDGTADAAELLRNLIEFGEQVAEPALVYTQADWAADEAVYTADALRLQGFYPLLLDDTSATVADALASTDAAIVAIELNSDSTTADGLVGLDLAAGAHSATSFLISAPRFEALGDLPAALDFAAGASSDAPLDVLRNATHLGRVFAVPTAVASTLTAGASDALTPSQTSVEPVAGTTASVIANFEGAGNGVATLQVGNGRAIVNGFSIANFAAQDSNSDRVADVVTLLSNQISALQAPQTAVVTAGADSSGLVQAAQTAGLVTALATSPAEIAGLASATPTIQQIVLGADAVAGYDPAELVSALTDWRTENRALVIFANTLDDNATLATSLGVTPTDLTAARSLVQAFDDTTGIFTSPQTVPNPIVMTGTAFNGDWGDSFADDPAIPVAARFGFNRGAAATVFLDGGTTVLNGFSLDQLAVDDLDGDGQTDSLQYAVNQLVRVGRVPVPVLDAPAAVGEGATASLNAGSSFDPFDEALTYAWDLDGDGEFDDGNAATANFSAAAIDGADGVFRTVSVRVTNVSGLRAVASATIAVTNLAPGVDGGANRVVNQGDSASFTATITDFSGDTSTVTWNFGDGSPTVTGRTASHSYNTVGFYTVTVEALDDDGDSSTDEFEVEYRNVAPSIEIGTYAAIDEGGSVTVSAVTSDPGGDAHGVTWTFGDGGEGSGSPVTHIYADNGNFTITGIATEEVATTVSRSDTATIRVNNVAPTFTSGPGTAAVELVEYTYAAAATDPGADTVTFELVSGPAGMTVSSAGLVTWTPDGSSYEPVDVTIRARDEDGGSTPQTWTIAISFVDSDSGGASDLCETRSGLDPDDASDDDSDVDGDGLPASAECIAGTDPAAFSGPPAPVLVSPIDRATWVDRIVVLVAETVEDPDGDAVTYEFEMYEDVELTTVVNNEADVAAGADGTVRIPFDTGMAEDETYWWRVRGHTADVTGPWSEVGEFVYNLSNAAPGRPEALAPANYASELRPTLQLQNTTDPEGEVLAYSFELFSGNGTSGELVFSAFDVPEGDDGTTEIVVDTDLVESSQYTWRARATDSGRPRRSGPYEISTFIVNTSNDAPTQPELISPIDGETVVATDGVTLRWRNSTDPDGDPITFTGALSASEDFSDLIVEFDNLRGGADGTTRLVVPDELPSGTEFWWRVAATDGTVTSTYASSTFVTSQPNRAPGAPSLVSPIDGAQVREVDGATEFVIVNAVDPDFGQLITYDIEIAGDVQMDDRITREVGFAEGADGQTTIRVLGLPLQPMFWRVRANDGTVTGPWSTVGAFRLIGGGGGGGDTDDAGDAGADATPDTGDDAGGASRGDGATLGGGTGCAAAPVGPAPVTLFLGMAVVLTARRRTRSQRAA